jgi:hypothetical protein
MTKIAEKDIIETISKIPIYMAQRHAKQLRLATNSFVIGM